MFKRVVAGSVMAIAMLVAVAVPANASGISGPTTWRTAMHLRNDRVVFTPVEVHCAAASTCVVTAVLKGRVGGQWVRLGRHATTFTGSATLVPWVALSKKRIRQVEARKATRIRAVVQLESTADQGQPGLGGALMARLFTGCLVARLR